MIHRLWLGPHKMPEQYTWYAQEWERLNPDEKVITWTETTLQPLTWRNQAVLDDIERRDGGRNGVEKYVQMADVIGYELIYQFGGVYCNVDVQPVRPLSDLGRLYKAWAGYEDQDSFIVNSIMGGPPLDPFWRAVIDELPERYFSMPGAEMNIATGPHLLTEMHARYPTRMIVFNQEVFNPVHWNTIPAGEDASLRFNLADFPNTVAVHHWGHKLVGRTNIVENATQPGG